MTKTFRTVGISELQSIYAKMMEQITLDCNMQGGVEDINYDHFNIEIKLTVKMRPIEEIYPVEEEKEEEKDEKEEPKKCDEILEQKEEVKKCNATFVIAFNSMLLRYYSILEGATKDINLDQLNAEFEPFEVEDNPEYIELIENDWSEFHQSLENNEVEEKKKEQQAVCEELNQGYTEVNIEDFFSCPEVVENTEVIEEKGLILYVKPRTIEIKTFDGETRDFYGFLQENGRLYNTYKDIDKTLVTRLKDEINEIYEFYYRENEELEEKEEKAISHFLLIISANMTYNLENIEEISEKLKNEYKRMISSDNLDICEISYKLYTFMDNFLTGKQEETSLIFWHRKLSIMVQDLMEDLLHIGSVKIKYSKEIYEIRKIVKQLIEN
jgi:hypothetical protein